MKTSLAWQDFRHTNLVSTSAPTQVQNGDGDDSDGAEEDGFVGANSNRPQEMMMEIMDKYVQTGEALAEKENEVVQLTNQVQQVRAANSDLEARVSHLKTSNEKLLDSEGRWYSLARELENQMEVIKKGETYSLFQDKVDEAEARLEVSTDANKTCRRRLFEVYGLVSTDVKDKSEDGSDEDVDEHRQHATILEQLQRLKSARTDIEDALDHSALATQQAQTQKEELRKQLETQISELRAEGAARDAAAQSEQDGLRRASAEQAHELQQALNEVSRYRDACIAAESATQTAEHARREATEIASEAKATLEDVREDLRLAQGEIQVVEGHLAKTRTALETSQHEAERRHEAHCVAESRIQQLSGRVTEMESLLQDAQLRSSQLKRDLTDSLQKIEELRKVTQVQQEEVAEATNFSGKLQARVDSQEGRLRESVKNVAELSATLETLRSELDEKSAAVSRAQSEADKASHEASAATEHASKLRQELKGVSEVTSTTTREYIARIEGLREELERVTANASASEEHAAHFEELRQEMEATTSSAHESAARAEELRQELASTTAAAASAAEESATHIETLRQKLENANTALLAAQERAISTEGLRRELEKTSLALFDAEDDASRSNEARMSSEARAQRAESAKADAVEQLENLGQRLALNETKIENVESEAVQAKRKLIAAEHAAAAATQALADARQDVLRAKTRATSADQAREEARQQGAQLEDEVRSLEAQLSEAKASATHVAVVSEEHRQALLGSNLRSNQLESRVVAIQAELDGRTVALARAEQEAEAMAAAAALRTAGSVTAPTPIPLEAKRVLSGGAGDNDACADVLFGSPAPNGDANASIGGREEPTVMTNGVRVASRDAEAEQLQAHAEAMELELRCTLESFEGQLSAMAREKVAIQKQLKELTGQCTTLRKQVSHHKKVAKDSEAQVEQILELQQQLCDAEGVAESLRDSNCDLRCANRDLTSKLEVLRADSANEAHENLWRQSQDEVVELRARLADAEQNVLVKTQELAAKAQEVASAKTRESTLEQQVQKTESEVLELKETCQTTAEELSSALTNANELQCAESKVSELESIIGDVEEEKRHRVEMAAALTFELDELQKVVSSLQEEKEKISQTVQQAEDGRAALVMQLGDIANLVVCEYKDGDGAVSSLGILDKIARLKIRVDAAEDLLEATAEALRQTGVEGEGVGPGSSWIMDGVSSLQRRLHAAESELSLRAEIQHDGDQGYAGKVVQDLSVVLECENNRVAHEVRAILDERQAARQQQSSTIEIWGELKDSYLNNMKMLASAIGQQAACAAAPLLAQASELCSTRACLTSTHEALAFLDQATRTLASFLQRSTATTAEVTQRQAQEEVAALHESLRKERLMMMAFRRWGHFYLALSNEALRKRTKERNHARGQRDTPERRSGRPSGLQRRLQLSASDVHAMVEKEAESVARELAREPSLSLLALADARKEMDDIAMKAQATLGVLYAQPPLTQDVNVATDGTMVLGTVEQTPEAKRLEGTLPDCPATENVDVVQNDSNVTIIVEAACAGGVSAEARSVPNVAMDHQEREVPDVSDVMEVPEDRDDSGSASGAPSPPPPASPSSSPSLTPPPMCLASKVNGIQESNGTEPGRSISGVPTVNVPPGRTTGPLVEDGISKKDRAEFLRKQREERKANRKKEMQRSTSRPRPTEASGDAGIRNRRTSAPAIMPSTGDVRSGFAVPFSPATSTRESPGTSETNATQNPTLSIGEDNVVVKSRRTPPPMSSTGISTREHDGGAVVSPPSQADSTPAGEVLAAPATAVRAPPPHMFNPAAVPPPVAPPSAAASSHAQPPRHPSIAFNVNETVERALTEARRDAGMADKRAAFWKYRFRELAVWAVSFVVVAYASDHSFEDC